MHFLLRSILLLCCNFACVLAGAQRDTSLTGVWKGVFSDAEGSFTYTIRITGISNGVVTGTGLSGNETLYCETRLQGTISNGRLALQETEVISTNYKSTARLCLLAIDVTLSDRSFTGTFRPISNEAKCLPGKVGLTYQAPADTTKTNVAVANQKKAPQAVYPDRTLSLIKEIRIDADEVELRIFDNGVVDGDLITLTDNGQAIFSSALLSTTPLKHLLTNKTTAIHEIGFVADNLGSIPPNTGLLVITANRQRWEINFSSDLTKTSYVRIILRAGK